MQTWQYLVSAYVALNGLFMLCLCVKQFRGRCSK